MVKSILPVVALRTCTLPSADPSASCLPLGDHATVKTLVVLCVVKSVVPRGIYITWPEAAAGTSRVAQAVKSRTSRTNQQMDRNHLIVRGVSMNVLFSHNDAISLFHLDRGTSAECRSIGDGYDQSAPTGAWMIL